MLNRSYFIRRIHSQNQVRWERNQSHQLVSKLYSSKEAKNLCKALIEDDPLNGHIYSTHESRDANNRGKFRVLANLAQLYMGEEELYESDHPLIAIAEFLNFTHHSFTHEQGYWRIEPISDPIQTNLKSAVLMHSGPGPGSSHIERKVFDKAMFESWSAHFKPEMQTKFKHLLNYNVRQGTHNTDYSLSCKEQPEFLLSLYKLAQHYFHGYGIELPAITIQDIKTTRIPNITNIFCGPSSDPIQFFGNMFLPFPLQDMTINMRKFHQQDIPFSKIIESFTNPKCPSYLTLDYDQDKPSDVEIEMLSASMRKSVFPANFKLDLSESKLSLTDLAPLIKATSFLTSTCNFELCLANHIFTKEDLNALVFLFAVPTINAKICLDLSNCHINNNSIEVIIEALTAKILPKHLQLKLRQNHELTQQGVLRIKNAFEKIQDNNNNNKNSVSIDVESHKLNFPTKLSFLSQLALAGDENEDEDFIILDKLPYRL
ncbi:MAG: hypothetical protein H0W64_11540 [Gammaproteobacteria bacterium]|nr:hypothetical protein [Gammaproteobacteria bacterium]